jgi:8-oxo-dGTP diphosphatase
MGEVKAAVKALLLHDNKYLFLREPIHHGEIWDLPGGKIEYGESPEHALHREVKEEVDLKIEIVKPVGVWWFFSQNSKTQVICLTYLCNPIDEIKIDLTKNPADEHFTEYRWLTISEVLSDPQALLSESLKSLLKKLLTS